MRPVLKPALRPLWRDPTALQFGVDSRHAVVVDAVSPADTRTLRLLDGTRTWAGIIASAPDPDAAEALLRQLADHGALDDAATAHRSLSGVVAARLAPDLASVSLLAPEPGLAAAVLARRRRARVVVVGAGRVGSLVASLLAAAGVRRLRVRDDGTTTPADVVPGGATLDDAGQPRARAAAAAARRAVAGEVAVEITAASGPPDVRDCTSSDLVVFASDSWPAVTPPVADALVTSGTPHLLAGVRETCGVIGPLVLPGRTSCARCHDLDRASRDPGWPAIAAQLATPARGGQLACDVTLAAAVAAITAGQALAHVAGQPVRTADATLELRLPEWSLRRRTWSRHPSCACAKRERAG